MKLNNVTIAILAGSGVLVLGLVTLLVALGRDPGDLIYLVLAVMSALGVGNLVETSKARKELEEAKAAVQEVDHKVNGRMTQLIDKAAANGHDVSDYDDIPRPDPDETSAPDRTAN